MRIIAQSVMCGWKRNAVILNVDFAKVDLIGRDGEIDNEK